MFKQVILQSPILFNKISQRMSSLNEWMNHSVRLAHFVFKLGSINLSDDWKKRKTIRNLTRTPAFCTRQFLILSATDTVTKRVQDTEPWLCTSRLLQNNLSAFLNRGSVTTFWEKHWNSCHLLTQLPADLRTTGTMSQMYYLQWKKKQQQSRVILGFLSFSYKHYQSDYI